MMKLANRIGMRGHRGMVRRKTCRAVVALKDKCASQYVAEGLEQRMLLSYQSDTVVLADTIDGLPAPTINVVLDGRHQVHSWDFGTVPLGSDFARPFIIRNDGTADLYIKSALGLDDPFALSPANERMGGDDWIVRPGGSMTFTISFLPSHAGSFSDYLFLSTNVSSNALYPIRIDARAEPVTFTEQANLLPSFPADDVFVVGSMAYVTSYQAGLQMIDVSNAAAPVRLGRYDAGGTVSDIFVSGSLAYVTDDAGLQIIDVSNPTAPVRLGGYDTGSNSQGVFVSGSVAYVADRNAGLQIIDVSNPAAPVRLGGYDTFDSVLDFFVAGSLAYVADYAGLQIIDVSNPTAPVRLGGYSTGSTIASIFVAGSMAYVMAGGLQIIDVTTPAAPVRLGGYAFGSFTYQSSLFVSGSVAYVTSYNAGLQIIDVSNSAAPVRLAENTSGDTRSVFVSGSVAYVADYYIGLQIIDVSNPSEVVRLYDTSGDPQNVFVSGSVAYVADGDAGLQIIDISNPAVPVRLARYDTSGDAHSVFVSGPVAYVADGDAGLQIIDVSSPDTPVRLGSYTSGDARSVFVSGSVAYVADGDAGLQIIDVSNPAAPVRLSRYVTSGDARSVFVSGPVVYVATGEYGLEIVDVSIPSAPFRLGDCNVDARGVFVVGSVAYVASGEDGLQIFDVNNPSAPVHLGTRYTVGEAQGVFVSGSVAYVVTGYDLAMIDVSNPAAALTIGSYYKHGYATAVHVSGDIIYVASRQEGVLALRAAWVGGGIADATVVSVPSSLPRTINAPGSVDWVAFRTVLGHQYRVEADPGAVDGISLRLLAPDGRTILAADEDGGVGWLEWTAMTTGTCYLVVTATSGSSGTYLLELSGPAFLSGTTGADNLTVRLDPLQGELQVFSGQSGQGQMTYAVPIGLVTAVEVDLGQGDDTVFLADQLPFTPVLRGSGSNVLRVGTGAYQFGCGDLASGFSIEAGGSAALTFDSSQTLASLTLSDSANLTLAGGGQALLHTADLTISGSAILDLADNSLIVPTPDAAASEAMLARITRYIAIARNGGDSGSWSGTGGITSTAASPLMSLGVVTDGLDVVVRLALTGDVNLTGTVDGDDYFLIDSGFLHEDRGGWQWGDLNYDGRIDGRDYQLIDLAFLTQAGATAANPESAAAPSSLPDDLQNDVEAAQGVGLSEEEEPIILGAFLDELPATECASLPNVRFGMVAIEDEMLPDLFEQANAVLA